MALGGIHLVSTADPSVDGLFSGLQWLDGAVTFGFPATAAFYDDGYGNGEPEHNFAAVTPAMMETVRGFVMGSGSGTLTPVSGFSLLSITEASTSAGLPKPDIAIAQSSGPSTAYAYHPASEPYGGDIWFGQTYDFSAPRPGGYAAATALHEFGHALGLKHPHEATGTNAATVPLDRDFSEYTVMTYRSAQGGSHEGVYTNEPNGYPQTYMMLDIRALQTLYGANYAFRSADTTYSWSPWTGEAFVDGAGQGAPGDNRVFSTIWDGGGRDTYDFSQYGDALEIDLWPGAHTVLPLVQRAQLAPDVRAAGNVYNALLFGDDPRSLIEDAIGGWGSDTITGNAIANALSGRGGNDWLTGGDGDDRLDGGHGADRLTGGAGADWLSGDSGHDVLAGGPGNDVFVFDSRPTRAHRDRIVDFDVMDDTLWLDNTVFKTLAKDHDGQPEGLRKGFFVVGSAARDSNDHVIFNRKTGVLYYDADGNGPGTAVPIATLTKKLKLAAADFLIV